MNSLQVVLLLCDSFCDSCEAQKSYMLQGLNGSYLIEFVTLFVTKRFFLKKLPEFDLRSITKNPALQLPQQKPKRGINSLKTKQYLEKQKNKKQPPTARSLSAVCGAPNRIRTCGLLIRSQTLYPAELWVLVVRSERKLLYQEEA